VTSEELGPRGNFVNVEVTASGLLEIQMLGDVLHVVVVPGAGGKISRVLHQESGYNVLWENPRVPLRRTYPGAPFDDVWSGGWDDIFPTDPPCEFDGVTYHDHGDLWIGEWSWSLEGDSPDSATVHLSRDSVSLPCRVDKWITVERDSPHVSIRLRLTNSGLRPVRFMWNQHIAHAIGPGSRVHVPASRMNVVGPAPSLGGAETVEWPIERGVDLSYLPGPEAGTLEFLYPSDLREGWCAVTHPTHGLAMRVEFEMAVFQTPWLWRVSGGWRGHHLLLTEPCTSRPGSLADAVANGSAAVLDADSSLETRMKVSVVTDFDHSAPGDVDPTRL
jgi:hypothetical protein